MVSMCMMCVYGNCLLSSCIPILSQIDTLYTTKSLVRLKQVNSYTETIKYTCTYNIHDVHVLFF